MTNAKLYEVLGEINEKHIKEALMSKKAKKHGWFKWGAMAACLCFVAAGAFCYKLEHPYPIKEMTTPNASESEVAEIPRWEDMPIYEQYSGIPMNGLHYTARCGEIPEEQTGTELASITATGWDEYADIAGEDANRYLSAAVYEIVGISPQCAVAVRYEGTDEYYAAVNPSYRPETLGQFIKDLNLEDTLVFNYVYYERKKPLSGDCATIRFENVESEKIWEMLSADPGAENAYDDLQRNEPKKLLDISVSIPLFGYENISISVRENGYIMMNILDTGKMFHIGEDNTRAFAEFVLAECEGHEVVWVAGDLDVPE